MVLAAYAPVADLLQAHSCQTIIVSTSSAKYSSKFAASLGFKIPGTVIIDRKRATHKAVRMRSSVYASLVTPFKKHLKTFGYKALGEALRVSLRNATAGHGHSWQQGGLMVLEHKGLNAGGNATCKWAWREEYPGDWLPVHEVLRDALGIDDAPQISFPERLDFVIAARNALAAGGSSPSSTSADPRAPQMCTEDVCSAPKLRARLEANEQGNASK